MSRLLIVCTLWCCFGCTKPASPAVPAGPAATLVFAVAQKDATAEMSDVLAVVERRVGSGSVTRPDVKYSGNDRISITFIPRDQSAIDRINASLTLTGSVELRIVADARVAEHATAIQIAQAQPADQGSGKVRDSAKRVIGKWVKLHPGTKLPDSPIRRTDKMGNDEILVVIDRFNVTGQYITSADVAEEDPGHSLKFALNTKGANLLSQLTASNSPDPVTGVGRELAVNVDDEIFRAAEIMSTIGSSVRITGGSLSQADLEWLATILKSGPLPAKLTLASETTKDAP